MLSPEHEVMVTNDHNTLQNVPWGQLMSVVLTGAKKQNVHTLAYELGAFVKDWHEKYAGRFSNGDLVAALLIVAEALLLRGVLAERLAEGQKKG